MSKIFIDLENVGKANWREPETIGQSKLEQEEVQKPRKMAFFKKFLIFLFLIFLTVGVGVYFYWQGVKRKPHYSLALLVDAAKRDDLETLQQLVDVDAVVDNFVSQFTDKAIGLYGRNIAPEKIKRVVTVISPILPVVKQKVRAEMLRFIREKTKPFEQIPWWAIAIGADKVLETRIEADTAYIKSNDPNREIELTMKREGDLWRVVAIKDERLVRQIAEKIGQEIFSSISKEGLRKTGEKLGISGIEDLMKKLEGAF
jgi:uncharacterized protein (DUF2164 family)